MAIYERKKKDGSVSYTVVPENDKSMDGKRNRKGCKTFKKEKDAEAYENTLKVKRHLGISPAVDKTTVAEVAREWLALKKDDLGENGGSYYGYEVKVTKYILPHMGNVQLKAIRTPFLQRYLSSLRKEDGKPFAKQTLEHHRIVLRGIFGLAVQNGIIQYNPALELTIPKFVAPEREIVLLDHDEVVYFLEAIKEKPIYTLAVILLYHGFRVGEGCGLRWTNIDWVKGTISITQQRTTRKGKAIEGDPKTEQSKRRHFMTDFSKEVLQHELEKQEKNRAILGEKYHDLGYVIAKPDGTPYHPNSRAKELKKLCERFGLPHVNPHLLRHEFASVHDDIGVDIRTIMESMGHTDERTTRDYIRKLRAMKVISVSSMDDWVEAGDKKTQTTSPEQIE